MAFESENQLLDNNILKEFSNVFKSFDIRSSDIKREWRHLGQADLTDFERRKLNSSDGFYFNSKDSANIHVSNPFGHIVYKGRPVILFIKDQIVSLEKIKAKKNGVYHICNCQAIQEAKENNRFSGRYVATYNTSGVFNINIRIIEGEGNQKKDLERLENISVKLNICQECLHKIGWKNFNSYIGTHSDKWWKGGDVRKRQEIVQNFNIKEFFDKCEDELFEYEDLSSINYSSNYIKKQSELSPTIKEWLKKNTGYRCEYCGEKFPNKDLQIHHKNHNEGDNRRDNLMVICKCCHHKLHLDED